MANRAVFGHFRLRAVLKTLTREVSHPPANRLPGGGDASVLMSIEGVCPFDLVDLKVKVISVK